MRHRFFRLPAVIGFALFGALTPIVEPTPRWSRQCAAAEPEKKAGERAPVGREKKSEQPGLDDALLKDLDNELLDGAGDLETKPKSQPAAAKRADDGHAGPQAEAEGEDIGMPAEDADPLVQISQQMRSVEGLIPEREEQDHAEQLQTRILRDLARLIEATEKQSAQQSSSEKKKEQRTAKRQSVQQAKASDQTPGGKPSSKPAQDSTDRLGTAETARPDPELLKSMMKDSWGHLPQKTREQMLQNSPERFLPKYELMIERYYKRLSEQQSSK